MTDQIKDNAELLSDLKEVLIKHRVYIAFCYADCSDMQGVVEARMSIVNEIGDNEVIISWGTTLTANDLTEC